MLLEVRVGVCGDFTVSWHNTGSRLGLHSTSKTVPENQKARSRASSIDWVCRAELLPCALMLLLLKVGSVAGLSAPRPPKLHCPPAIAIDKHGAGTDFVFHRPASQ